LIILINERRIIRIEKEKIKNITIHILEEISKFADEIIEPLTYSGMKRNLYFREGDPKKINNNIYSLERRGYIEVNRKNDSIILTSKGQIKLIENSTNDVIDGKWRMISFDIPEIWDKKRRQLCRSIKRIGFKRVQKSLWACPFIRADEVELIVKELGLEKYVAYLIIEKVDIEKHLRQLFKSELK